MAKKVLMTPEDIRRTLARISHETVERNRDTEELVLVGMRTRGVPLARRLATNIANFADTQVPVGALDITPYRDDLTSSDRLPRVTSTDIPINIDGKTIVLVDDVLYTGRSTRAAMDALTDLGRPRSIQLAVLVDRGHRELPIRPDYIGKNIPTSRDEEVLVHLIETDGNDEVTIANLPNGREVGEVSSLRRSYHVNDH